MSLAALYAAVVAELATTSPGTSVVFGKRQVAQTVNQGTGRANRVVFVPGDGASLGTYTAPQKQQGRAGRSLWDWRVAATVHVWAHDPAAAENELTQWNAMVELHDLVVTAIHNFAAGMYEIRAPRDASAVVERPFGCATAFVVALAQPVVATTRERTAGAVTGSGSTLFVGPDGSETPVC